MAIKDIMTSHPVYCTPETQIEAVARLMAERNCGEIPVCEEGRVVGVITDRDIVMRTLAKGQDPVGVAVRDVMTPHVVTIRPTDSINRAVQLMEEHQLRRLPVVNDDGQLTGMVAQADLAEALPEARSGELLYEISHPADKPPHRII